MAEVGMKAAAGQLVMGADANGAAQFLRADGAASPIPAGATIMNASSGNIANNSAAATLDVTAPELAYVTGFEITAAGATGAAIVVATLAGVIGGTMSFIFGVPAGATAMASPLVVQFPQPIPAAAAGTDIVLTLPALGAGNTNAAVVLHGFKI